MRRILALEQCADFSQALEQCNALRADFEDRPEFAEKIHELCTRIAVEKCQADALGFAASGLANPHCAEIALQAFLEAGETGRLVLHRTYRQSPGEMQDLILKKLQVLGDEQLPALIAERFTHNPSDAQQHEYVEILNASLSHLHRESLPALFAVAKSDLGKFAELDGFLYAAARRAGAEQPAEFAKLFNDSGAFDFFANTNLLLTVSTDGLVVYFPFDEGSGKSALNTAPGIEPKKADVQAGWIAGKKGSALKFNGTDEMATYSDSQLGVGRNGADFTLAFWLNLEKGMTGSWRNITHKGFSDDQRTFALWMRPDSDSIHCRISTFNNGNEGVESTASKIPLNTWTHIAYVKHGNTLRIFINGKKDSEQPLAGRVLSNTGPIYIGKDPWYPGLSCAIDEYRIYTRALTVSEINLLATGN